MNYLSTLYPAYAEIFLLVMACFILIADLFVRNQQKTLIYLLVQFTLLGLFLITYATHQAGATYLFNNMFVDDQMSDVLKMLSYLSLSMVLPKAPARITLSTRFTPRTLIMILAPA